MAQKAVFPLVLALWIMPIFAQDARGGLIEGDTWAFLVSAPQGWVWDSQALRSSGIQALFYREGSRYSPAKPHIVIRPMRKKTEGTPTLDDFIKADEDTYAGIHQGSIVKSLSPYTTSVDYAYSLRELDDKIAGSFCLLAYYEGPTGYFAFELYCQSPEDREHERAAFLELLDSFTYMEKE
jgi:hypothetical protein